MATVGVDLTSEQLVLTHGRDFRWQFENKNKFNASEDFPSGDLFLEFDTGGQVNAEQRITVTGASGGNYTLSHDGNESVPIDFADLTENPTSQHVDILDALEGISSIGAGNIEVTSVGLYPAWRLELNLDTGNNEVQQIGIDSQVVDGEWRIFHGVYSTGNLEWDVSPAILQTELEALTSIGVNNVSVTQGTDPRIYVIEFIGALAETPVPSLVPSQIGFGYGLSAPDPSGIWGNIGILFTRFISRSTLVPGTSELSEAMQALIVKSLNDFFNVFEELLGVDIDYTTTSRNNMVLTITSRKRFDENSVLAFVLTITSDMIEGLFNGIVEFLGIFDTINIDFYWNYIYDVQFIGSLAETSQVALVTDATNLTGLPGDPTSADNVEVEVVVEGLDRYTYWYSTIDGDTATFHEHSPAVNAIQPRVTWQLVFAETSEDDDVIKPNVQGGDAVARGKVTVLK